MGIKNEMSLTVTTKEVESRIIVLRDQPVLIDADVAELYGVETKRINEAVRNNPHKFPDGYFFVLDDTEKKEVVENFDHLKKLRFSPVVPTAFTERGLYMLATILRTGDILAEVVGRNLSTKSVETEIELNFAVVKIKHKVIRDER